MPNINELMLLKTIQGTFLQVRNELLAVGANDPYVRIYDRRKIKTQAVVAPVRAKYNIDRMNRRDSVQWPVHPIWNNWSDFNILPFQQVAGDGGSLFSFLGEYASRDHFISRSEDTPYSTELFAAGLFTMEF